MRARIQNKTKQSAMKSRSGSPGTKSGASGTKPGKSNYTTLSYPPELREKKTNKQNGHFWCFISNGKGDGQHVKVVGHVVIGRSFESWKTKS